MAILDALRGIAGGVAGAAGDPVTAAAAQAQIDKSRLEKAAQLRSQVVPHGQAIQGLQQKLSALDPKSPEYNSTVDEIQSHVHAMREILHPDAKLGAGDWLKAHTTDRMHITNHDQRVRDIAAKSAQGVAQDKDAAQAYSAANVPYAQSPEAAKGNYDFAQKGKQLESTIALHRNIAKQYGLEDQADEVTSHDLGIPEAKGSWKAVSGTIDGEPVTLQHNEKTGAYTDINGNAVDATRLAKFQPAAKGNGPKVGSFGEFLTAAYGPSPTPEQEIKGRQIWAQSAAGTTVGDHVAMVPQLDGSIKAITIQTTSQKSFGAAGQVPKQRFGAQPTQGESAPPTAAPTGSKTKALQRTASPRGAGVVGEGKTVGGRDTPAVSSAKKDLVVAAKLLETAKEVAKKPDDAFNQKRLAVALERQSAGRFTVQALDYIKQVGWGNTIEEWANKPGTGALSTELVRQLIDGAQENYNGALTGLDEAKRLNSADEGDSDLIYAKDPSGKVHKAKKGTPLPKGWALNNGPS